MMTISSGPVAADLGLHGDGVVGKTPTNNPSQPRAATKRPQRQPSLRRANSVELTHRRMNSAGSNQAPSGTAEAAAAAREGRQFTVGNVGNNGMIFLRPVIRPSPQKPPNLAFPPSPAAAISTTATARRQSGDAAAAGSSVSGLATPRSPRTPSRGQRSSQDGVGAAGVDSPPVPRLNPQHHRAHSFSTVSEKTRSHETDHTALRVLVNAPDSKRPRTAEEPANALIEVAIPNYRLGSPRFSARGTAILRSSVYTRTSTTDGMRSSAISDADFDPLYSLPTGLPLRASHAAQARLEPHAGRSAAHLAMHRPHPGPSHRSGEPVDPHIYDYLTFPPLSEHSSIVRYSPTTGGIAAATPPRLIAQITSPNFLDYDLLSDFFLTFRSFMPAFDLVAFLMARLQWAIDRQDDVGKIVKVRTFVALRHWVLNYFADDFVPDRHLRARFCSLLHDVCVALDARPDRGLADFKLIGELKKCWRRTCDLYWDGPKIDDDSDWAAHEDIQPGGPAAAAATAVASLTRDDWPEGVRPVAGSVALNAVLAQAEPRPGPDAASPFPIPSQRHHPPMAPHVTHPAANMATGRVVSAASEQSVQALSCSLPTKPSKAVDAVLLGAAAHPVEVDPVLDRTAASFPLRSRAGRQALERSGSFSEAVRRSRAPAHAAAHAAAIDVEPGAGGNASLTPGSLIRGSWIAPSPLLIRPIAIKLSAHESQMRMLSISPDADPDPEADHKTASASSPGVRKLLGTMRRALSTRNGWAIDSHSHGHGHSHGHINSLAQPDGRRSPSNRSASGKGRVSQVSAGSEGSVRLDRLHEKVFESFRQMTKDHLRAAGQIDPRLEYLWDHRVTIPDELRIAKKPHAVYGRHATDLRKASEVSMGSKSIVIINDTAAPPLPPTLDELRMLPAGAGEGPSRPWTASDGDGSMPIRPGHMVADGAADALERWSAARPTGTRPSSAAASLRPRGPGMSHRPSMRSRALSYRSTGSVSLRKYASYHGGIRRRDTLRSFDATTLTGSDVDSSADNAARAAPRMLRRRPGGDLRAARKMTDLGSSSRPRSAGSLTTRTTSLGSSIMRTSGSVATGFGGSEYGREQRRRFSLGALAEAGDEKALSLLRTHSSQPNLRPSFEAEVAKLARLPDQDEDGGVESTLLKLEGRFQRQEAADGRTRDLLRDDADEGHARPVDDGPAPIDDGSRPPSRAGEPAKAAAGEMWSKKIEVPSALGRERDMPHSPSARSEESYSSIPLLERGLSERSWDQGNDGDGEDARSKSRSSASTPRASVSRAGLTERALRSGRRRPRTSDRHSTVRPSSGHESFLLDDGDETDPRESFLLDEDEDLSDLSSELSMDGIPEIDVCEASRTSGSPVDRGPRGIDAGLGPHPLRHPPSPPPSTEPTAPVAMAQPERFTDPPLTPEASPVDRALGRGYVRPAKASSGENEASRALDVPGVGGRRSVVHLPFILAYDADVVAQQLTLCEKDALSEIDWRDLVELRWRQTLPPVHDWVEYLKAQAPRGVELVVARFNVMVKWALSEIVMTREVHERARTLSKFIQIAKFARRYRNYATMYQITVALLSTDCSRLTETWNLVPAVDVRALNVLENLVQPVRNFHNLRVEMETATAEEGCIPFLGIYTHDLVFNSHRPSRVAGAGGTESLVNFERYRTTASVVKNLLRLIEGSTRYRFTPMEGLIDRCLWLAALPDSEIRELSKTIR